MLTLLSILISLSTVQITQGDITCYAEPQVFALCLDGEDWSLTKEEDGELLTISNDD